MRYDCLVGRIGIPVVLLALTAPAAAQRAPHMDPPATTGAMRPTAADMAPVQATEPGLEISLGERWHDIPSQPRLKLSVQITDELTELGNLIGSSMNELSDDIVGLKFDGRHRRAKLRLGTGEGEFLRFRLESDWHFSQGKARVAAKLQLGVGQHQWNVELPDVDIAPAAYHDSRGVEVRIPFFERRW
jgi:hypothetical protein